MSVFLLKQRQKSLVLLKEYTRRGRMRKALDAFAFFPDAAASFFLPPPPARLSSLCINFLRRDPKKGEAAVAEKTEAASALLSRPVPGMESDNLGKISEKIYVLRTYRSVASFRELLR